MVSGAPSKNTLVFGVVLLSCVEYFISHSELVEAELTIDATPATLVANDTARTLGLNFFTLKSHLNFKALFDSDVDADVQQLCHDMKVFLIDYVEPLINAVLKVQRDYKDLNGIEQIVTPWKDSSESPFRHKYKKEFDNYTQALDKLGEWTIDVRQKFPYLSGISTNKTSKIKGFYAAAFFSKSN